MSFYGDFAASFRQRGSGGRFNELQAPRIADAVRRVYGENLEVNAVSPEVLLAVVLENDPEMNRFSQGRLFWTTTVKFQAAVAAQNSEMVVGLPATAQHVATVEGIVVINPPTAANYSLGLNQAGTPALTGATVSQDTRFGNTAVMFGQQTRVLASQGYHRRTSQGATDLLFNRDNSPFPVILSAGKTLSLSDGTVNEAMTAIFWGQERQIRPEELVR